jgi:hypothetical protein
MEHPTPATESPTRTYPAPTRGFAVASVALGYFSMIVFFWKPFSLVLSSVGFVLGVTSWAIGNRGGLRGEPNTAVIGTLVCGFSAGLTATLYKFLGVVQWDFLNFGF